MGTEYLAVAALGFLGSVHCLGMCGGLVACVPAARGRGQALYQAGRLAGYVALGALLGTVGLGARLAWNQGGGRWLMVLAAVVMIMMGLQMLGVRVPLLASLGAYRAVGSWMRRLLVLRGRLATFGLGLVTALLPCGLLYAALLRAAAGTGPLEGALVMASFWAGTTPALLGLGVLMPLLGGRLPAAWPRVAGAAVVVLGLLTASHALLQGTPRCH